MLLNSYLSFRRVLMSFIDSNALRSHDFPVKLDFEANELEIFRTFFNPLKLLNRINLAKLGSFYGGSKFKFIT